MSIWRPDVVLITCEHAGNEVPPVYRRLFRGQHALLRSHRGYDIGALGVALQISAQLSAPILFTRISRLLIDNNRSPDHPELLSTMTRSLDAPQRQNIINNYYAPHQSAVKQFVRTAIRAQQRVLHVGVHSFTDVLDGVTRELDIALLFDPSRDCEASVSAAWLAQLRGQAPALRHRANEPYQGVDDGLASSLRRNFDPDWYAGLEIEMRQGLIREAAGQRRIGRLLAEGLAQIR